MNKLYFAFLSTVIGSVSLLFASLIQAGGAPMLYLSSTTVGETAELTAKFNGSSLCVNDLPNTVDSAVVNVDFFERSNASINFDNSNMRVIINSVEVPGYIENNFGSVLHWKPSAGEIQVRKYDNIEFYVDNVELLQTDLIGFWTTFNNNGLATCVEYHYGLDSRSEYDLGSYYKRLLSEVIFPTSTPTYSPTNTPSPTPTRVPTATPTPTTTPVPLTEIGFADQGPVEVTVEQGKSKFIFSLVSIGATQYTYYGYPTSYGPGINTNPDSGGVSVGGQVDTVIQVNSGVPVGTYTGNQIVKSGDYALYSLIPVTVHVISPLPTPTVTPVPTLTPTLIPTSTPTVYPTPTPESPLQISSVLVVNLTKSSATINWLTNVPGTSMIQYGTSIKRMTSYTSESTQLSTTHAVDLNGLSGGKTYYYRVYSRDSGGELHMSGVYNFSTPRR